MEARVLPVHKLLRGELKTVSPKFPSQKRIEQEPATLQMPI